MKEIHKKILLFVKQYMLEHDYPPTTREIGTGLVIRQALLSGDICWI